MKVLRSELVDLMVSVGFKAAGKWDKPKALKKLEEIIGLAAGGDLPEPEDDEDGAKLKLLNSIVEAGVDKIQIVLEKPTDDEDEEDDAEEDAEDEEDAELTEDEAEAEEINKQIRQAVPSKEDKAAKKKARAAKKKARAAKKAEKPARDPNAPKGVRGKKGRAYYAGQVIKEVGLKTGVTAEMVARVDELCGEAIPRQTGFVLRTVWQAINGYVDTEKTE